MQEIKVMNNEKPRFWGGFAAGAASILLVLVILIGVIHAVWFNGLSIKEGVGAFLKIHILTSYLQEKCLEETETEDLLNGAYAGLVGAVDDTYTRYYTQEQYEEYLEELGGSYAGIGVGVQWNEEEEMLQIVSITEGGPGDSAGLCVGDWVYEVDGMVVQGMSSSETIRKIKGDENTKVTVTVIRDGKKMAFDIVRQEIVEESVDYQMLEGNIGYIALTAFDEVTTEQFMTALDALEADGIRGMIMDLRSNPGGRLQTAIDIADALLPEGTITYTENKQGEQKIYSSDEESLQIPMVVLINENSASASEILAGAIQDMGVGTLVGMTTYGKGIVQSTYGLPDGSAIKMTMARYYTPNGRYIHGEGITPDIEIDLASGDTLDAVQLTEEDIQFRTALEAIQTLIDTEG